MGDAAASWLRACSRDSRVAWIALRAAGCVCAWSAGARVPERIVRAAGSRAPAVWRDPAGRCELLVGVTPRAAFSAAELARLGQIAAALVERAVPVVRTTDAAHVLHDLAQLVAHAELELASAMPDAFARVRTALRGARELLDEARTSRTNVTANAGEVDLASLLEREARRASASRPDAGVKLRVRVRAAGKCELHAPTFERLARNLIVNALQASPRGGTVTIDAEVAERRLELVVRDEGRGLDSRAAARLFTDGAEKPRGRGIGARSVRACAEALGADIAVRSRPGEGTEVRVCMPATAARAVAWLVDPLHERRLRRELALAGEHGSACSSNTCADRAVRARLGATTRLVLARGADATGLGDEFARARARGEDLRVHVLGWDATVPALG